MFFRNEFWTYAIVTAVTALIWFWAASATRDQRTLTVPLLFDIPGDDGQWTISPPGRQVTMRIEGPTIAIQDAGVLELEPLVITMSPGGGKRNVNLLEGALASERLDRLGISLISVEPSTETVEVQEIKTYEATVRGVNLPGIEPENVKFDPPTVSIRMPSHVRLGLPDELVVAAFVDSDALEGLAPGRAHTELATVRLRADTPVDPSVMTIMPDRVNVTFNVASLTSEKTLETVRVHVAGPHEDFQEYEISLQSAILQDVVIRANKDLIHRISSGEVTVIALLHLSNQEKEQGITSKPVSYFIALGDDWSDATPVDAIVDGSETPPDIGLTITRVER